MQDPFPHHRLFVYLENFIQQFGFSPTIAEMATAMGKPRGSIQNSLNWLERQGYIARLPGKARAIQILKPSLKPSQQGIPLCGKIAAGYLSEVLTDSQERLLISSSKLKPGDFALQVVGDSMIGDQIPEGSFVILRPVSDPSVVKDGQIVAAWVEGCGTTLKHFFRQGTQISLVASNPKYPPILVDTQDCQVEVQGVLVGVWREWDEIDHRF